MTLRITASSSAGAAGREPAARALLLLALLAAVAGITRPALASVPAVCASEDDEDDEDAGETKKSKAGTPIKFDLWGACAEVSGSLTADQQRQLHGEPNGFSGLITRRGVPARRTTVHTVTATGRLETTRKTALGELTTAGELTWSADDDSGIGTWYASELYASLAGFTVGYTDSLMNFWSGEFSFNATAPQRTVGIVSYKYELSDAASITAAIESGPPTTRSSVEGLRSVTTTNPVLTARWLYETDDLTVHLSGLLREARFDSNALLPFLDHGTTRTGRAVSVGATIPVKPLGDDDEFSMQATYAIDASPYLGTTQDLSSLSSTLRTTGPTIGWSVVGSLQHVWSEQWKSNVFVSYLALDAELRRSQPTIRTKRGGANLQFLPVESLTITGELGYVDTELHADRAIGFFNGFSGRALISYVTVEWKF
jgi:hypothetical protein